MVYLWSMGVVAATALPMALYRPVLFLALVAVFSFYAAFSGCRVTKLKAVAKCGSAQPIDWIAGGITFCSSAAMAGLAIFKPAVQHMGVVAVIFGCVGMQLSAGEMLTLVRKPKEKMLWWYSHLGNMIGSYIAAWTAFSVTTLPLFFGHSIYLWLWPIALGSAAITVTTIYCKRKFSPERRVVAA